MAAKGTAAALGEIATPDISGGKLFITEKQAATAVHGALYNAPRGKRGRPPLTMEVIAARARVKQIAREKKQDARHPEGVSEKRRNNRAFGHDGGVYPDEG